MASSAYCAGLSTVMWEMHKENVEWRMMHFDFVDSVSQFGSEMKFLIHSPFEGEDSDWLLFTNHNKKWHREWNSHKIFFSRMHISYAKCWCWFDFFSFFFALKDHCHLQNTQFTSSPSVQFTVHPMSRRRTTSHTCVVSPYASEKRKATQTRTHKWRNDQTKRIKFDRRWLARHMFSWFGRPQWSVSSSSSSAGFQSIKMVKMNIEHQFREIPPFSRWREKVNEIHTNTRHRHRFAISASLSWIYSHKLRFVSIILYQIDPNQHNQRLSISCRVLICNKNKYKHIFNRKE